MGRVPLTHSLGLSEAGVELNGKKIVINQQMQTTQSHIFAAGDVCSPLDVVHLAIQQGEIAARYAQAILTGQSKLDNIDYRLMLFGVFSHPQVAVVGGTEATLSEQGRNFITARYPFADHGKSMVMGETQGFVKMLADPITGEILGACVVGPEATELIHEISVAMHFRSTVKQFIVVPHYHPTLSEIWTYPAEELADMVR
jgi:pyruvate/2-oxoglutarate dehydrogenase complex dihydrolipoamide dehydrogenase (E3) component